MWDTSLSRVLSTVLVAIYVIIASAIGGPMGALRILRICIVPLACVWYPDAVGRFIGGRIARKSPRSFVWFFGWVVLLLPLIQAIIIWSEVRAGI